MIVRVTSIIVRILDISIDVNEYEMSSCEQSLLITQEAKDKILPECYIPFIEMLTYVHA